VSRAEDILDKLSTRRAAGEPFALATVVRTVAATAAKAGAKAVILPDGTISEGWIGGGCARAAVLKAARDALADGRARLVSVQPPDLLAEQGVTSGEEKSGVRFASNMCPSQGSMDIFVEPVLPRPQVMVCGSSPVAVAVADLARRMGFAVTACAPAAEQSAFGEVDRRIEGYALPVAETGMRYIVVSTQGRGDEAALLAALAAEADYVAFVGSRRKAETLKAALAQRGVAAERLARLKAPAGLDLGAITPDEIALSILAEIVALRRGKAERGTASGT
jgi:xanthine dehydrogenase accessory factor